MFEKIEKKKIRKKYSIVIGEPNLPSMYLTQISWAEAMNDWKSSDHHQLAIINLKV